MHRTMNTLFCFLLYPFLRDPHGMMFCLCIIDSLSVPTRALPILEVRPTYGYSQVLHGLQTAQGIKCLVVRGGLRRIKAQWLSVGVLVQSGLSG